MRRWWLGAVALWWACGAPEEPDVRWWGPTILRSAEYFFVVETVGWVQDPSWPADAPRQDPQVHVIWARSVDEPSRPIRSLEDRQRDYFGVPADDYCDPVSLRSGRFDSDELDPRLANLTLTLEGTDEPACGGGAWWPWACSLECYGTPWLLKLERP